MDDAFAAAAPDLEAPDLADPAGDLPPLLRAMPRSGEFAKLRKRLLRETREALEVYGMVRPGDRWLVCLSGGKDSCDQSVFGMHQSPH